MKTQKLKPENLTLGLEEGLLSAIIKKLEGRTLFPKQVEQARKVLRRIKTIE